MNALTRRRWFRFGLRTMFVVLTVASVWMGWQANSANLQREAVESISKYGHVVYHHEFPHPRGRVGRINFRAEPAGPRWLRTVIGDDYFRSVLLVSFTPSAAELGQLKNLPQVENVYLDAYRLTDRDMVQLGAATSLKVIGIRRGHALGTDCLAPLQQLPDIETLEVTDTPLTDLAIVPLRALKQLKVVRFYNTLVSREGVDALSASLPSATVRSMGAYQPPSGPLRPMFSTNADVDRNKRQATNSP